MTTKEKNKRKNDRRAVTRKIKVFNYGFVDFGEPSKSRLESMKFQTKIIRTYRRDYRQFSFVKCKLNELNVILVIRFEKNKVDRSSCQLLKNWDPRCQFIETFEK
jgi:hypothetical protein